MTNKEALDYIRGYFGESQLYQNLILNDAFEQIRGELEMIDLFKRYISVDNEEDEFPDFSIMFMENEKADCDRLQKWLDKRWLEDDK